MSAKLADIDLTGIHFGYCKMLIGYAAIDGECISIGGCSRIAEGVDYSAYFYNSKDECLLTSAYNRGECPENSTYDTCGTACPPTCEDPNPEECIALCVEGCFCNDSLVWNDDNSNQTLDPGECIVLDNCPATCSDLTGDLNDDEHVDILDIVTIVDCILQENDCVCADTNNDNTVDILDVVSLVNQILNNCENDADNDGICDDQDCINENNIIPDPVCSFIYDPVCGCDEEAYSNLCLAEAAGVTSWISGECARDMQTCLLRDGTEVEDGWTGKDTDDNWCNSCFCNDGALGCTKMGCPPQLEPDAPSRDCWDENLMDPLTACTRQYAPVCGCDEQTYSNACRAESAGLTSWTEGECFQDEECPAVCCYAMTASCLACSECQTVEEYCLENPNTLGCEEDTTDFFG